MPAGDAPVRFGADTGALALPTLVLNEVQPSNDSTWMDADGGFPDWIELLNTGEEPVDLDGVLVMDEEGYAWRGVGVLRPGERLVLVAGVDLPFDLDDDGERLTLSWNGRAIDRLDTGAVGGDLAWARVPDGGAWTLTARPTPGVQNGNDAGDSLDPSDALFDPARIQRFDLYLSDAAMRSLDADPYTDVEGAVGYDGAWLPRVGVRIKGVYGSLRTLDEKASFKVDLNEFEDRRLRGLEHLVFNNMAQDPSYTHETLAYGLWRAAGQPAPRTGWANLWVNGEDWGLYVLVEPVDDTFARRWWGDTDGGSLWEGAYGVDFTEGEEELFELDWGSADLAPLAELGELLDGEADDDAIATLETLVDLDAFLAHMALEAVTLHWDGYTTQNNYRVWHDPGTGLFSWIPWGADQTFAWDAYVPYDGYGRVLSFCLDDEGCAARYDDALLATADLAEAADLEAELDALLSVVASAADPRCEHDAATILAYQDLTRELVRAAPERVREAVAGR